MEMAQRNEQKRRVSAASSFAGDVLGTYLKENRFAGSNQQGRAARWSSRGLWRKSFLAAVSEAARKW